MTRFRSEDRPAGPVGFAAVVGVVAVVGLMIGPVLSGCGQGFDRDDAVVGFSAANPEISPPDSECVVDRLIDRYGVDGLEEQLVADPADESFQESQFRDMFACGIEGDVRSQIIEQLQANQVSDDDAPCVADVLVDDLDDDDIDVLLSGEITERFLARFMAAMEECGAINS